MTMEPRSRKIVLATGAAVLVAAIVLVVAVLPAEFGIDPLGIGRLLGLTALADDTGAIHKETGEYRTDSTTFELGSYSATEYKYTLPEGGSMVFSWKATKPVIYDFHSEPEGGPEGYAESFDKGTSAEHHGTYTAPFAGIHGWYWENPGSGEVTITLNTSGFYTAAQEIGSGGSSPRPLRSLTPDGEGNGAR